jgi:hypothetical protein
MAVPTYTEDLTDFDLCENDGGTFGEFTGMADGGTPDDTDVDDVIQGSYLTSASCSLKVGELQSIYADYGSGITVPTDGAVLIWFKFDAGGLLATVASYSCQWWSEDSHRYQRFCMECMEGWRC